ncbi:hypothetical protein KEJ39_05365, partial [Candidatus Bathyarchaeota archaeon]|nr:hypothetical protein [Candidatus Bathyarchaeota archaeon]
LAVIITKRKISSAILLPLVAFWAVSLLYMILEELDPQDLLGPSSGLMTVFALGLALITGLAAGLIPSVTISNLLAGRWRPKKNSEAIK